MFIAAAAAEPALAVEGALGRTLPGTWVQPQGAVVGPEPGFGFAMLPIGYTGAIGGARLDPVAGTIYANVHLNMSSNFLILDYVYRTESWKVSLSSAFMGVVNWVGASGSLQSNNLAARTSTSNGGAGDAVAVPLTVGIHFSENNIIAISTWLFAPNGLFGPDNLSNLGMGVWTVMPNVAHTYMWKRRSLEFDNFVGFDIYRHNHATNYTSGTVFHWDAMAIRHLSKRVGVGAIGSNLTQITTDQGPLAGLLKGFQGRSWGAGPIVTYVAKIEKPELLLQLRWVNEFKVTNLLKGNSFMFGLTLKLD
jgi:hypothetical protein